MWWLLNPETPPLFHPLLLKRYATANNPAIANASSNPGIPFSSDFGISVAVTVGVGVSLGVGVGECVGVRIGEGVAGVGVNCIGVGITEILIVATGLGVVA